MSNDITKLYVHQYASNLELLLQQKDSRFAGAVMNSTARGTQMSPVDQIGAVNPVRKTTRHGDTPLIETPHARRWCVPTIWHWADMIDQTDKLQSLLDPQGAYTQNGAAAMRRAKDDEIINAFFATSKVGVEGASTEAFDTAYQVPAGGTGMTVDKLREAKRLLMRAQVDVDNEPLYCAITSDEHDDLLNATMAISLDYTTKPVLMNGRITSFMGFNFIDSERLLLSGTDHRCPVWAKSGMALCTWEELFTDIGPRRDKSMDMQVYVRTMIGATRVEQGKVIDILCA